MKFSFYKKETNLVLLSKARKFYFSTYMLLEFKFKFIKLIIIGCSNWDIFQFIRLGYSISNIFWFYFIRLDCSVFFEFILSNCFPLSYSLLISSESFHRSFTARIQTYFNLVLLAARIETFFGFQIVYQI